jgi:DNA-binding CsgD family transcriptional regulator
LSSTVPLQLAGDDPAATDLSRRLRSVQRALQRLGSEQSLGRLVNLAPRSTCEALELDRAMLLHISGNTIVSGTAWWGGDQIAASDFARFLRAAHPNLSSCPPELQAAQRRQPILVTNAQKRDDVYRPLVHAARSEAYIVAPLICADRVIGLLHADRLPVEGRPLDALDRDLLWTFASGLADLIGRATARGIPPVAPHSANGNGNGASHAEMDAALEEISALSSRDTTTPAVANVSAATAPLGSLTAREHEVLTLLAEGAANAGIARRLVISEATVKSHVRHILRKLRAANRTEAVIRYQMLMAADAETPTSS